MNINTQIIDGKKIIETKVLIDCGTQGTFMDERFTQKHWLLLEKLKKEIPVSNIDETLNRNGPIKQYTWLSVKIDGNIISTWFYISHLGKENIIFELPWLEEVNLIVNWAEKTLKIIPKWIKKLTRSQATDRIIQIYKIDLEQKKPSQNNYEISLTWRLNERNRQSLLKSNEDTTPKFERLSDNKEAILIAVNELPNQYEDIPALILDNKDDEEELTEGDLLIAYLQGE